MLQSCGISLSWADERNRRRSTRRLHQSFNIWITMYEIPSTAQSMNIGR
jgi:hypothetical protein